MSFPDRDPEVDRLLGIQIARHHHHELARAVLPHREQVDDPDDAQRLRRSSSGRISPRKRLSSNSTVSLWTGPCARISPLGSSVTAAPSMEVRCRKKSTAWSAASHRPIGMSGATARRRTTPRRRRGSRGGASRARTGDPRCQRDALPAELWPLGAADCSSRRASPPPRRRARSPGRRPRAPRGGRTAAPRA